MSSPERSKLKDAIEKDIEYLTENDVWDLVDLPKEKRIVGSKWIFKWKFGADRNVERYKAWLVAQGYFQGYHADYDETFSLLV